MRPLRIAIMALGISASTVAPATGQATAVEDEWVPPIIEAPALSLMEAVELTLKYEPSIHLQDLTVERQAGLVLEEQGRFDTLLRANLEFSYERTERTKRAIEADKKSRTGTRNQLNELVKERDENQALIDALRELDLDNPNIPVGTDDAEEILQQIEFLNALIDSADGEDRDELLLFRDELVASEIQALTAANERLQPRIDDIRETLQKMGIVPMLEDSTRGAIDLSVAKPFRTGLTLGTFFTYTGSGFTYVGKQRSSSLGGPGSMDLYNAKVGFSIDLPLGRGGGWASTTAGERAALSDLAALEMATVQTAASSVLSTSLAYWDLVAAQQRLTAFQGSLELQQRLVSLTSSLVDGDELARSEISRVRASEAASTVAVRSAERQLQQARVRLAQTIGLDLEQLDNAPLASTGFPPVPDEGVIDDGDYAIAVAMAEAERTDIPVARQFVESELIRLEQAKLNLRPNLDASARVWYTGIGEDNNFDDAFKDTFERFVGPSASLSLSYSQPLRNRLWRGRLLQQEARVAQEQIITGDLRRNIHADVVRLVASIEQAVDVVSESERVTEIYRSLIEDEFEKLKLGTSTLIDTIFTEQRLTEAALDLVGARYQYAVLLSQLRFQTGTLVEPVDGIYVVEQQSLLELPYPLGEPVE